MLKHIRRLIAAVLGIGMITLGAPVSGTISNAAAMGGDPIAQDIQNIDGSEPDGGYCEYTDNNVEKAAGDEAADNGADFAANSDQSTSETVSYTHLTLPTNSRV